MKKHKIQPEDCLPYVFDLFHDIKTKQQLAKRLKELINELTILEGLMERHRIELPTSKKKKGK